MELANPVDLPNSCKLVWEYFLKLHATRQSGMGLSPISYSEILAFSKLYYVDFIKVEIDLILLIDSVVLQYFEEKQKTEEAVSKDKPKK